MVFSRLQEDQRMEGIEEVVKRGLQGHHDWCCWRRPSNILGCRIVLEGVWENKALWGMIVCRCENWWVQSGRRYTKTRLANEKCANTTNSEVLQNNNLQVSKHFDPNDVDHRNSWRDRSCTIKLHQVRISDFCQGRESTQWPLGRRWCDKAQTAGRNCWVYGREQVLSGQEAEDRLCHVEEKRWQFAIHIDQISIKTYNMRTYFRKDREIQYIKKNLRHKGPDVEIASVIGQAIDDEFKTLINGLVQFCTGRCFLDQMSDVAHI